MKNVFNKNPITGCCHILLLLLALSGTGCTLPPATQCLGAILQKEIRRHGNQFTGYRCTAGAHRGDSVNFTENTLTALEAAADNPGYAFVEFDVQYTRDGKIVVFHDKRLLRLFGSLRAVGKTDFEDLFDLTDGEIAAYDDVMAVLEGEKINIEIKSQGDDAEDFRLADAIIADLNAGGRADDVMISSISEEVVKYISRNYPRVPTGQIFWLSASTFLHFDLLTARLFQAAEDAGADYLLLHVANLRNLESLLALKPSDKTIIFWDFDDAIYLVHRHFSDRLWGHSGLRAAADHAAYMLLYPFYRFHK